MSQRGLETACEYVDEGERERKRNKERDSEEKRERVGCREKKCCWSVVN